MSELMVALQKLFKTSCQTDKPRASANKDKAGIHRAGHWYDILSKMPEKTRRAKHGYSAGKKK